MVIVTEKLRHDSYGLLQRSSGITKFKQAENKASFHLFGKCIFSRCDESRMGTEICLLFGTDI